MAIAKYSFFTNNITVKKNVLLTVNDDCSAPKLSLYWVFLVYIKMDSMAKRVAVVYDKAGKEYSGLDTYTTLLLRNLDPQRYNPVIVIPGYKYNRSPVRFLEEVKQLGVPIIATPETGKSGPQNFSKDVYELRQFFRQEQIEVVHINTGNPLGQRKLVLGAWLAGVRAIVRNEHMPPSITLKYKDYAHRVMKPFDWLTDYIVTVSESDRQEQIKLMHRKPHKVYCAYAGVDLERFKPSGDTKAAKIRLGFDPNIPLIGAVGRLDKQKGFTYLIEAAAEVSQKYSPVNFLLVGGGEEEQTLKEQVARHNLEAVFHFAGAQNNVVPYLEAMDITVMSSLYESFGFVLAEYMAMGKPSVATDIPVFAEIVKDGESAVVVKQADAPALAKGLIKLLNNPELAQSIGQAALQRVRLKFNVQRLSTDLMRIYDQLLGQDKPKQPRGELIISKD